MLKLQAKIFNAPDTTINGVTITVAQLSEAVTMFNGTAAANMVTFDSYPGQVTQVHPVGIIATAKLHMDGEFVIATVTWSNSALGKFAGQLYKSTVLQLVPVTSVVPRDGSLKLQIRQLIIPSQPTFSIGDTPLQQVKDWVSGVENWPMYELKEHK